MLIHFNEFKLLQIQNYNIIYINTIIEIMLIGEQTNNQ